jgi:PAS domain S-box-containing protein
VLIVTAVLVLASAFAASPCVAAAQSSATAPELVVAANIYEPFVFERDGHLVGFDVDLVNMIASLNGWTVHYEVMPFADELAGVEHGTVDLGIGSIFWTRERAARFAYSDAYLYSGLVLVTPAGSAITSTSDLRGRILAAKDGTASDDYAVALFNRLGTLDIRRFASSDQVFDTLANGQADAAIHDYLNAQFLISERYQGNLIIARGSILDPFLDGRRPLAYPASRNMLPLLSQLNSTLGELRRSGILAQLETKWFGSTLSLATTAFLRSFLLIVGLGALAAAVVFLIFSRSRESRAANERASYYQQVFSAIPEPALLVSESAEQLRIEAVNHELCVLLARREDELLNRPLAEIMRTPPGGDGRDAVASLIDRSFSSTRWQLVAADRTMIPVEVRTSAMRTPSRRTLIVAHDLRDQLKAEQSVRNAYEQYHALFDEGPDPVFILNNYVVELANNAAEKVLGAPQRMIVGKTIAELSPANQPGTRSSAEMSRELEERALAGETQRFDWVLQAQDGRQIVCSASLQLIPSAGTGVLQAILRDVTEQRMAQEHSLQLERELLQSQKMEAVGRLAGGIAHDFNNIMGGIMGHASLLRVDAAEGTELYQGLDTIERAARRAAELTRRLLSFSRKEPETTTDVNVGGVLNDTLAIAMPGFDKRIALAQTIAPELDYVAGDRTQLEEVFLNLIINARDAMAHKEGRLTVDAVNIVVDKAYCESNNIPGLPDGSYVRVKVADTGCGIAPEARDHLFEPFFTTRPDGTGLGLSIVWRVVHDHGGSITVDSAVGEGTTFTIYLPAIARAEAQSRRRQVPVSGSLPRATRGESILIVDDEDIVRSVAVKVLSGLGYHVVDTADPVQALTLYADSWHSIDLVLIDMMMPHMNGRELFEQLRTINPQVAAILMSGYDATETPFESTGFVAFIPKPYTLQELAFRVRQSLDTSAAAPDSVAETPTT